jgi:formylglycine-generating enzyme required for sulfatase activity
VVGSLRYIREGTFIQGSPADEPCRLADETQFTHTLTRGLICMEMEMTRLGWTTLKARQPTLPADPSTDFGMGMLVPVQRVTWYEAILFANLLSVDSGLEPCYYKDAFYTIPVAATNYTSESFYCNFDATGYRLPTEGEWEYICRAGGTGPFQNTVVPNYTEANCGTYSTAGMYPELEALGWFSANSEGSTHPCGMGQENDWGMLDMIGNVLEWCWDYYGTYPTGAQSNYTGGAASVYRVIRGGAWDRAARYSRSARRGYCAVDARFNTLGFRLVRTYR